MGKHTLVSLFCGCGGFDVGAVKAGFEPLIALDNDPVAIKTYTANIGEVAELADLTEFDSDRYPKEPDLLLGGPPCQGFSSAGLGLQDDPRNTLWKSFLEAVSVARPKYFILENVTGFHRELESFKRAITETTDDSYNIESKKIIAHYYGVPQFRYRLFVAGVRKDIASSPCWPIPGIPEIHNYDLNPPPGLSMTESLQVLGPPVEVDSLDPEDALCHSHVPLRGEDFEIAQHIPNGGSLKEIPDMHLPTTYVGRVRGRQGWTWYYRKPRPFLSGRTVLSSIRPNYATILSPDVWYEERNNTWTWKIVDPVEFTDNDGLYTSPVLPRRLTIRECARLQSFPDEFQFYGTMLEKHRLIGNAVPCELAFRLCDSVRKLIDGEIQVDNSRYVQSSLFEKECK